MHSPFGKGHGRSPPLLMWVDTRALPSGCWEGGAISAEVHVDVVHSVF